MRALEIRDGKVFVNIDGEIQETKNPELIGNALLDEVEGKDYTLNIQNVFNGR